MQAPLKLTTKANSVVFRSTTTSAKTFKATNASFSRVFAAKRFRAKKFTAFNPVFTAYKHQATKTTTTNISRNTHAREYTTAAIENLQMTVDHGNYKLPIPLPTKGTHVFSMHEDKEIVTLINDIREEDHAAKSVHILNKHGNRVARCTPVSDLLRDDFLVSINDGQYYVKAPPRSTVNDKYVSISHTIMEKETFIKLRSMFEEKAVTQNSISYQEYLTAAEDLGVSPEEAKEIIQALTALGVVLHFDVNPELRETILLRPKDIAEQVERSLDLSKLKENRDALAAKIVQLKAELAALKERKEELENRAALVVNIIIYGVLVGLFAQFALFARLTWWDYSWDVIEPITWFTTVNETIIAGYIYYLLTKREFGTADLRTILLRRRFRSLAKKAGWDIKKYESLQKELAETQAQFNYYNA